jgi:ABC-type sugar transport system, periplasmic component
MKYKRLVAALAVISVCSTVLVGCGEKGKNEDKSEKNAESVLTFWDFHTGTEAEVIENMIDEYNASQDKVKVEYSSVNQTDYTTTLVTTAYANGECPDILWVEPATFKKFTDADMLTDLTEYYSDDLKEDMLPSFLEAATGEDGKMYTLPFECETLGLFYDADLLEEAGVKPPKTWDELLEAAKK